MNYTPLNLPHESLRLWVKIRLDFFKFIVFRQTDRRDGGLDRVICCDKYIYSRNHVETIYRCWVRKLQKYKPLDTHSHIIYIEY